MIQAQPPLSVRGGSLDHPPQYVESLRLWQSDTILPKSAREEVDAEALVVEGAGTFDVEDGKRLVLAIEEDAGVDILHDVGSQLQKR
jgi:hypothetical protein